METTRQTPVTHLEADFAVVGGGLAGLCAAVAAARHGTTVILVQDRPVLGGNASSEIRMGICGAHGKDRKETGLLEEIQLNNIYHNPLMRYTLWDDILLSLAIQEPNLTLLLNTSVHAVSTDGPHITAVTAWNANEYRHYRIAAQRFADCSGDGILHLSGADCRHGREDPREFHEDFLQTGGGDRRTMGNSILLQLRKTDAHHPFLPPPWAHRYDDDFFAKRELTPQLRQPNLSYVNPHPDNNNFWWIEFGGNLDVIHDAGLIQRELKRMAYGIWDYMKNHPDGRCRHYDLDWMGSLPGKRESRRFLGDILLNQHDLMSGGHFHDTVCYGGWTIDDHHPDAFMKLGNLSEHHTPPSPFGIPYRALYSRNIDNLWFAGRNISCTHIAMSATRVMATCALMGQAVGTAAALATRHHCSPRDIYRHHLTELQLTLMEDDVFLPGLTRPVSAITQTAHSSFPTLQTAIDRNLDNTEHGAWLTPGQHILYTWPQPVSISNCRLVFDSLLDFQDKRMRKLEALPDRKQLPSRLPKAIRIETQTPDDAWHILLHQDNLHCRLLRAAWPTVTTTAIRLTVEQTWGSPTDQAHLFTVEYR